MFTTTLRLSFMLAFLTATTPLSSAQNRDAKPVGFELQFHGVLEKGVSAGYDVDIRFDGATEDWEYMSDFGLLPYSPQKACKAFESFLNTDNIETAKLGDTGLVTIGYRTPDGKLNVVKSVKITPRSNSAADRMPTIKDTRPKA